MDSLIIGVMLTDNIRKVTFNFFLHSFFLPVSHNADPLIIIFSINR